MVTKSQSTKRDARVRSPSPSFLEQATYYVDGDSFFEAVKDSDEESPTNAVVAVEDGRLPASILDFAEENGYAFYYIMSDGSEVGLQKTPEKKDFTIGVLLE
jgi:hypothetical protein